MKRRIGKRQALALLKRAVKENGADYVDMYGQESVSGGLYWQHAENDDDGWTSAENPVVKDESGNPRPACIVGHVLCYAGVYDWPEKDQSSGRYQIDGRHDATDIFTEEAVRVLAAAQQAQDRGYTWGDALAEANEAASYW